MTDHSALNWLLTTKHVKGRVARWALFLQAYDFTIKHRPGNKNQNADAFSRMIPIHMALTKELEEESTTNSRWIQVHFSALDIPGCQTKWQWNGLMNNRQYRRNSYSCNETDHHSHWYCIFCFQCANPYGNYITSPNEQTSCKCDDYYQEFSDYISEEYCQQNESSNENLYSQSDNESEYYSSQEDLESVLDGKGKDWRQDMHNIFLQAAEFKQTTVKQMQDRSLVEVRQDYSVNCTLCGKIITMDLEHDCIVGYKLGQVHPEMIPEALINEIFWDIPEKVQQHDEACRAAVELLQPPLNPQTSDELTEDEFNELFNPYRPTITPITASNFNETQSRVSTPELDF
jgi:hypothetical protein